ncbi:CaiB/BaiF CoA-transferase family protein [Nitratireductor sp. ZSWI3]|uniref:CaiB/BaiF CoA transferase family protein n=1 Tax=Nitratireductor sp. ZSWI3 TaxID=2966359 RepID=UPI00214F92F8|nr:CaiB/BaiF CoA-transferase family protein [Nitratireductor sp. ZSWI3]MCR4265190.1 CoA transferase [Nitratireductor sp. ZSWI3]
MKKAFQGYRIIDTTHVLAGPFAAFQLATLGAEVIKVEDPNAPDQARFQGPDRTMNDQGMGTAFLAQGSNKSSIALDLKTEEGREAMLRLLTTADVFIENYRPGAFESLGLGYDDLKQRNPGLIFCSLSAFGATGPRRELRGYDNIIQAFSGFMAMTGDDPAKPFKCGAPIMDYAAGTTTAYAIAAALLQRERNGGMGVAIDVSMLDVAMMFATSHAAAYFWSGKAPGMKGNAYPFATIGLYHASDAPMMVSASNLRQQRRLWSFLGRPDMIKANNNERLDAHEEEAAVLRSAFLHRPAAYWEDALQAQGVPCARIRRFDEAVNDPQMESRRVFHRFAGEAGTVAGMTSTLAGFTMSEAGPSLETPPQPLGAQTDEILASLGYPAAEIAAMRARGIVA